MLHQVVASYSQKAVPEGHALYDLSFGNDKKTLPIFRNARSMLSNAIDTIFGGRFGIGKKPLQTLLASSSAPFVDIRRDREKYYVDEFPSDDWYREEFDQLYQQGARRRLWRKLQFIPSFTQLSQKTVLYQPLKKLREWM